MNLNFVHSYTVLSILVLSLCFSPAPLRAEEPLTLDQCLKLAMEKDHLLKSFGHELHASIARIHQAKAFPQPEINFDSDLQPKLFQFGKFRESYLGVNQLIEFPGRRNLRGKIAGKEHEIIELDTAQARLDIIYNVKRSFFQLLLAIEIHNYAKQNLAMTKDYFTRANEKYQNG